MAVRIPNHPIPIALIRGLGAPIIGTSANVSGEPGVVTAGEVRRQMGDDIDFIIDEMADFLEREKIWMRLSDSESRNITEIGKRIKRIKNITQGYITTAEERK